MPGPAQPSLRPVSTQENKHQVGPNRNKIETAHGLSVPIFLFRFEPVIRNPDDKELKYFQLFWSGGADNIQDGKKYSLVRCLFS